MKIIEVTKHNLKIVTNEVRSLSKLTHNSITFLFFPLFFSLLLLFFFYFYFYFYFLYFFNSFNSFI